MPTKANADKSDIVAAIGRVMLAAIFLWGGYGKLTDQDSTLGYIQSVHLPEPMLVMWVGIFVELIGGLALAIGSKTRIVATALAAFCLVAAFAFHTPFSEPNQLIHFLKNIAMAGGLLQIVAFGPGRISVDHHYLLRSIGDDCRQPG